MLLPLRIFIFPLIKPTKFNQNGFSYIASLCYDIWHCKFIDNWQRHNQANYGAGWFHKVRLNGGEKVLYTEVLFKLCVLMLTKVAKKHDFDK